MNENWLSVGSDTVSKVGGQEVIRAAIAEFEWIDVQANPKASLPFSQGTAIKEVIKHFDLTPLKIAYHTPVQLGTDEDSYGFYGIKVQYREGVGALYVVDDGMSVTPVLSISPPMDA